MAFFVAYLRIDMSKQFNLVAAFTLKVYFFNFECRKEYIRNIYLTDQLFTFGIIQANSRVWITRN